MNIKKIAVTSVAGLVLGGIPITVDSMRASADVVNATGIENTDVPMVLSDEHDDELPEMSLSEALESGVTEAIVTDFDVEQFTNGLVNQENPAFPEVSLASAKGYWKYKYTVQPYAFYQHTKTKKWKYVQVTSTTQHVVNTVGGAWAGAPSWGLNISYNPPRR